MVAQYVVGVDEAGRGPVFGPLVVAAVWLDESTESQLKEQGVCDSKKLTKEKRERLFSIIMEKAAFVELISLDAKDIDERLLGGGNLNVLELETFSQLMSKHPSTHAFIDCPSTNLMTVRTFLAANYTQQLTVEHKADANYVSVAAASIIAKVTRDRAVAKIQSEIGLPIGSGYTSDPVTQAFLKENYKKYDIFRKSWKTYKNLAQQNLMDF